VFFVPVELRERIKMALLTGGAGVSQRIDGK
jgi:hypothetical protein